MAGSYQSQRTASKRLFHNHSKVPAIAVQHSLATDLFDRHIYCLPPRQSPEV